MDAADLNYMQKCGRLYATTDLPDHLSNAATLAACANLEEQQTLRFYWEEGVRNYCGNMFRYNSLMSDYNGLVKYLTTN